METRSTNLARGPSKWTVRKKLQIMINLIVFRIQVWQTILARLSEHVIAIEQRVFPAGPVHIGLWSEVASQMMTRHR